MSPYFRVRLGTTGCSVPTLPIEVGSTYLQAVDLTKSGASRVAYSPRAPGKKAKNYLTGVIKLADVHATISVPETSADWEKALRCNGGKKGNRLKAGNDYAAKWVLRSRFFFHRLAQSDKHLDVGNMSVQRFSTLFPDNGGWITRLCPREDRTVKGLFSTCDYHEDPLLFSMYACLFADKAFKDISGQQVSKACKCMRDAVVQHRKKHKQNPHPAILWQQVQGG